jgi:DNA-binding transcriptional MerR regulator
MTELLLSADVAKELGVTPAAIRIAASKGQIDTAAVTAGGVRLFSRQAVEEFRARRERRPLRAVEGK